VYFVYSSLLSASKIWLEKSDLSPAIGVWWVHVAALGLGLYLLMRDARQA
jgi:lipopolysaccharide export LptBFGC system permease protein LptF